MSTSTVARAQRNQIVFGSADESVNGSVTLAQILKPASKFRAGVEFTVEDVVAVPLDKIGDNGETQKASADDRRHLLLVTSIADPRGYNGKAVLWLSSSYIPGNPNKFDINGNDVVPDGSFDQLLFRLMDESMDKSLTDACAHILAGTKDCRVVVRRKPYTEPRFGRQATIPVFDIVA